MSTMYGADVAQLRTLAGQFDRIAGQLDGDRMAVGNAIQISAWVGPVAVRFRHTWDSDYSRKLHGAAERLRHAAGALRANADDQERTSAAGGGSGAGTVPVVPFGHIPGGFHTIGGPDFLGEARQATQSLVDHIRDLRVGGMNTWDMLGTINKAAELAGVNTTFHSFFDSAFDAVDIVNGLANSDPKVIYPISHVVADAVGNYPNPAIKLLALNLHMWSYVGEEASKSDFSAEGRAQVGNYIVDHPAEALQEVGKSVLTVGQKFLSFLSFK